MLQWQGERGTTGAWSGGRVPDELLLPEGPDFHLLLGLSPAATTHQTHRQSKKDYSNSGQNGAFHPADSLGPQALALKAHLLFKPVSTTNEVNTYRRVSYLVSQAALSLSQRRLCSHHSHSEKGANKNHPGGHQLHIHKHRLSDPVTGN